MTAVHPGMEDRTSFDARSGAAKHPQTSFPTKWGMKDQTSRVEGPAGPGSGPDASSPNPLSPEPPVKTTNGPLKASWGMTDADGDGVDSNIGGKVLGEAVLGGSGTFDDTVGHLPSKLAAEGVGPKYPR